jgi:hypothetical protein
LIVRRLVSALVLLLWTACYGHCLAEQHGLIPKESRHCCAEETCPFDANGSAPVDKSGDNSCGLCDYFEAGVLSMIQPLHVEAAVFEIIATLEWTMGGEIPFLTALVNEPPAYTDTGPERSLRLWEYLVRTALPVRGPCAGS